MIVSVKKIKAKRTQKMPIRVKMKRDESNNGKGPYRESSEPCEAVMMNRRRFRGVIEDFKFSKRANEHPKHVIHFPITSKGSINSSHAK